MQRYNGSFNAHDLLKLSCPQQVEFIEQPPDWFATCQWNNWAVVRRAPSMKNRVAIGLRGATREQRAAAEICIDKIVDCMTPRELSRQQLWQCWPEHCPLNATLQRIAPWLEGERLDWGPTGSVGFTLASGHCVHNKNSDLDIVIRLPEPPTAALHSVLTALLQPMPCRIDIQIESPYGGFALAEWIKTPQRLLLKTDYGPRLVSNPWRFIP